MEKIKLFEIPIYSMSKEEYDKRCMKYINRRVKETTKDNIDFYYDYLMEKYLKDRPWKYNQIIGFIDIYYEQRSIFFNEYITSDKNIRAVSNRKHYIKNTFLNSYSFYIKDSMNNEEIKNKISYYINSLKKDIYQKNYFFDDALFQKQVRYIDIKGMIKDNIKNK